MSPMSCSFSAGTAADVAAVGWNPNIAKASPVARSGVLSNPWLEILAT